MDTAPPEHRGPRSRGAEDSGPHSIPRLPDVSRLHPRRGTFAPLTFQLADSLPDSLWELIEYGALRWPDAPMLKSRQGDRCNFAEYRERAEVMAAGHWIRR
jgi:hypothetical protein